MIRARFAATIETMARLALRLGLVGSLAAGMACVVLGLTPGSSAGETASTGAVVTITLGKPTEFAFRLSPSRVATATVTFAVTNRGKLPHAFKVCKVPVTGSAANSCAGTATRRIAPGGSTRLVVTFTQSGAYEYLSPLSSDAAKGMKGTLAVTLPPGGTTTTAAPAGGGASTAAGTTTTSSTGDAAAGQALFVSLGCVSCHSVSEVNAASGGNVSPSLNSTHTGGPFPDGPLTPTQISQIAAYVSSA